MIDRNELTKLATELGGLPVLANGDNPVEAGVRYGDILLSVNGVRTPDWAAFIEARRLNATSIRLEVFRDGAKQTLELSLSAAAAIDPPAMLAELLAERIVPLEETATEKKLN